MRGRADGPGALPWTSFPLHVHHAAIDGVPKNTDPGIASSISDSQLRVEWAVIAPDQIGH